MRYSFTIFSAPIGRFVFVRKCGKKIEKALQSL